MTPAPVDARPDWNGRASAVVERSIVIAAQPAAVWRALTDPDQLAQWMGGTRVETTWEPGSDIVFDWTHYARRYHDHGTVLTFERDRVLRYDRWTEISRLPDRPEHRAVIAFNLEPRGEATGLVVRHDHFEHDAAYRHANYWWHFAIGDVKRLIEEGEVLPSGKSDA